MSHLRKCMVGCSAVKPHPGCEDGTVLVSGEGVVSSLCIGVGVCRVLLTYSMEQSPS
jgi:hypothetical protein